LMCLQSMSAAGDLDAGGHSLRNALAPHLLKHRHLTPTQSLKVWLTNLQVWGSRSAGGPRPVMAWKQRCGNDSYDKRKLDVEQGCGGKKDVDSKQDFVYPNAVRHWELHSTYCNDCGCSLKAQQDLMRHKELGCGGIEYVNYRGGDRVECRERGGEWQTGIVTNVDPLEISRDGDTRAKSFDDVRVIVRGSITPTDVHVFSLEQAAFDVHKARFQLGALADQLSSMPKGKSQSMRGATKERIDLIQAQVLAIHVFVDELRNFFEELTESVAVADLDDSGSLVTCQCGHNGVMHGFSLEQIAMHVRQSGVVPPSHVYAPTTAPVSLGVAAGGGPSGGPRENRMKNPPMAQPGGNSDDSAPPQVPALSKASNALPPVQAKKDPEPPANQTKVQADRPNSL